jgi:diguanylate cyclase (GGDEF)-like protein
VIVNRGSFARAWEGEIVGESPCPGDDYVGDDATRHRFRAAVVARPETTLPRAADPARADWEVADLFHSLFSARDAATVLARLRAALAERVRHDELAVYALEDERLVPAGGGFPLPADGSAAARAVRRRRPVLVPADPEPHLRLVGAGTHLPTQLGVPLVAQGAVLGAVQVEYADGLVDRELELVFRLCDAGALALANARERDALEQQARTDSLTGLLNQRSFHERLERALAVSRTTGLEVAVAMLDIDDFKWVNDVHGHDAADDLLVLVGEALRAVVRPEDAVCRLGGEEFAVVLGGVGAADAAQVGDRIRDRIAALALPPIGSVTVSVGVATAPRDAVDARRLGACAEAAMMTAKARGKNGVVLFDEETVARPVVARGEGRPLAATALRAAARELQRLGRLAEVAERVTAAAASLARVDDAGVHVLAAGALHAAAGSLRDEPDLELAERCLDGGGRVVERGDGVRAALPLRCEGRPVGVLLVAADGLREAELRLLELLADEAAVALGNALLYEAALADSERAVAAGVASLANALEASDGDTHEHARWIADFSCDVARELGLDEATVERVGMAALLHDIGKIGIGESVLLKPGRLTAAERAAIEQHPELGERILAPIDGLRDVPRIVRHCHERWDGAGYPDGLAGEAIPLEARIVFACDAYHAMTSDRPYRKALRRREAIRRLEAGAGCQFDPRVVAAVLEVLGSSRS